MIEPRNFPHPCFPGYVFLRGGLEQQLRILTTPGVLGLVGFAGVPAIIPDAEIEAVRQTLARRVHVEPHPFLKCGDWVRVKDGPLEGIEGILVRNKNQFRLVLSVELVQKSAAVEVDAWMVERAPKPRTARVRDRPSLSTLALAPEGRGACAATDVLTQAAKRNKSSTESNDQETRND